MDSNKKRFSDGYQPSNLTTEGYKPKPIAYDNNRNVQNGYQPEKSQRTQTDKPVPPKKS